MSFYFVMRLFISRVTKENKGHVHVRGPSKKRKDTDNNG